MKNTFVLSLLFTFLANTLFAQTLGIYNDSSVSEGGNITIIPSSVPTSTNSISAFADAGFTGQLYANPSTGIVSVVNASPAGTFTITVKAFGTVNTTKKFSLTITPSFSNCNSLFNNVVNKTTGTNSAPRCVRAADLNNDGELDLVSANYTLNTVSVRLRSGSTYSSTLTSYAVGTGPRSIAVGDFNGDGNQDIVTNHSEFCCVG